MLRCPIVKWKDLNAAFADLALLRRGPDRPPFVILKASVTRIVLARRARKNRVIATLQRPCEASR